MTEMGSPPSKIALFVVDVDGTLLNENKELTKRACEAVHKLRQAGIAVALATSRPPLGVKMLIEPLAIDMPIAGFNGGVFVQPDMTIIEEHPLSENVAGQAVELILGHGLDVWAYRGQDWLVRNPHGRHVAAEQSAIEVQPMFVPDFNGALMDIGKIVGISDEPARMARCEANLQQVLSDDAIAVRSQSYFLDVTHPLANKGAAIETFSTLLRIPMAEIATIGDMPSDVFMFRNSGLSIAMGNASPEVQGEARFVTASNWDEGFAQAVDRYLLDAAVTQPAFPRLQGGRL